MHTTMSGLARPFHPIDEMGHLVGGFGGLLPDHKEIETACIEGGMLRVLSLCSKKHMESLEKIEEVLFNEQAQ